MVIPNGATAFLSRESYIQCFQEVERLDVAELLTAFENGRLKVRGRMTTKFIYKIRDVVRDSEVLTEQDIQDCLSVLHLG